MTASPPRRPTSTIVLQLLTLLLLSLLLALFSILHSASFLHSDFPPVPSKVKHKHEIQFLQEQLDTLGREALDISLTIRDLTNDIDRTERIKPSAEQNPSYKKWWIRHAPLRPSTTSPSTITIGSILPIDLTVNHLPFLSDFLPVVVPSDVDLRWRSSARPGSSPSHTVAHRAVIRARYGLEIVWDSGRVDGFPEVVRPNIPLEADIYEWRVTLWDTTGESSSDWSGFAVGPTTWNARWISHPVDVASWTEGDSGAFWGNNDEVKSVACHNWNRRKQLPLFRGKIQIERDNVEVAMLVVSGLGSFRTSVDGVPLSDSGPLDPPLTDYAQRVSYRGFDITSFVKDGQAHVIGIATGSGWWDHRPITGSFIRLFYFPHGAVTVIAQVHVRYTSGEREVLLPTGDGVWQVAKGHLRESSLFTGEYIDLGVMASMDGWDTPRQWTDDTHHAENQHSWMESTLYESDTTLDAWRYQLHVKATAQKRKKSEESPPIPPTHKMAPIGTLVPHETPPVLPMAEIYPDEIYGLGNGRWMIDFGRGFSGTIRFPNGLPAPIVPENYPRGHTVSTLNPDESFITVIYGERLELSTGDINLPLVAGMGLHDGGPNHRSKSVGSAEAKGGPCYPEDHIEAGSLMQRDVYILPPGGGSFSDARQSHFTTHAFRFVEVCCVAQPPEGLYALSYRAAFREWGEFSSSNVRINGGYELVKNAFNSNLLGVQSDCPHREKIQYGGDINANAPSALHFYDMSAFYRKVVFDWRDQQWDNGAYAGTSYWLALNDYAGIGNGAGETVWATAPPLITVRHFQHYGDLKLLEQTFDHHLKWFLFLREHFDSGMKSKNYDEELKGYLKEGSGLGDWLSFRGRDTWLTHQSFYMAVARCIAYMAMMLGKDEELREGLALATQTKNKIARLYLKNGNDHFLPPERGASELSPGPEMSLYSRVVPGEKRCAVLRNFFRRKGHTWPGSEELRFLEDISSENKKEMILSDEISKRGDIWAMGWSQWHGFNEGIFAIRYSLKTLSDNGFHNVALSKATGFGVGTWEYMLSHNATTHWESWWRSEDLYSHNHPMLGASAEWMVSSVAGVSLYPTTQGGEEVLFWPRFPNSAKHIEYASATQGTRRGDFSIAWEFLDLPIDRELYDSALVTIHIRAYVPPDGKAFFRMPEYSNGEGVDADIKYTTILPDIEEIKSLSKEDCERRRKAKMGFDYNWEFLRATSQWERKERKKAIGTPCHSFLFHSSLNDVIWSSPETIAGSSTNGIEVPLGPGLYDVFIKNWQLKKEVKSDKGRIGSLPEYYDAEDVGPYCADSDTFEWNIYDATHLI